MQLIDPLPPPTHTYSRTPPPITIDQRLPGVDDDVTVWRQQQQQQQRRHGAVRADAAWHLTYISADRRRLIRHDHRPTTDERCGGRERRLISENFRISCNRAAHDGRPADDQVSFQL